MTIFARDSTVKFPLYFRHITDPALRQSLRHGHGYSFVIHDVGNVILSIV